jgi:hypothetical protein
MLHFLINLKKIIQENKIKRRQNILGKKILKKNMLQNEQKVLLSFVMTFISEYLIFSIQDQKEDYMKSISITSFLSILRYYVYYLISK